MIRAGDVIRVWDYEFMVVFDGRQSLIGDYSRPSSLSNIAADSIEVVRQRHKNHRTDSCRHGAHDKTYQKARAELRAYGVTHSYSDTGSDIPGGGAAS
jgi:hypothetical protein